MQQDDGFRNKWGKVEVSCKEDSFTQLYIVVLHACVLFCVMTIVRPSFSMIKKDTMDMPSFCILRGMFLSLAIACGTWVYSARCSEKNFY